MLFVKIESSRDLGMVEGGKWNERRVWVVRGGCWKRGKGQGRRFSR